MGQGGAKNLAYTGIYIQFMLCTYLNEVSRKVPMLYVRLLYVGFCKFDGAVSDTNSLIIIIRREVAHVTANGSRRARSIN